MSTATPCSALHKEPAAAPRRVSVLGSTGSIGSATVDVLLAHRERFAVEALVANCSAAKLADQARALRCRLAVVADEAARAELAGRLAGTGIEVAAGRQAVIEAAARPADLMVGAIVGAAGLEPTLAAVRRGVAVALANKECLVLAGQLFMAEAARAGAPVIPVDSEHSAIFQILGERDGEALERIVLTASGGPFRGWTSAQMAEVTPQQALRHPNWAMGAKITVDSATMMNKGLELIEAHHLFGLAEQRIDILVHPESAVHGLVEFADGSLLAQLGAPDMRTPIAVSLAWPARMAVATRRLDLVKLGRLTFEAPDEQRFPALRLAREALRHGGAATAVLNAANEVAVESFLAGATGFLDIARIVETALTQQVGRRESRNPASLDEVLALDARARSLARDLVARLARA